MIMNVMKKGKITSLLLFLLMCAGIISFIYTPLTGDLEVFIAAAEQAKYNHAIEFFGAIQTWELKGIGSRIFIWCIYKITLFFAPLKNPYFPNVFHLIYLFAMILGIMSASVFFYRKWREKRKALWFFMISVIGITFTYCCNHGQNEMTGVIVLLLATGIYVGTKKPGWKFLAGILFGMVFYLKSVLLVMGVSFLGAVYLMSDVSDKRQIIKDTFYYLLGAGSCVFGGLLLLWKLYPIEIIDMLNASAFQNTLLNTGLHGDEIIGIVRTFLGELLNNCMRLPIVFVGLLLTCATFIRRARRRKYAHCIFMGMLWLSPVIFVVLSNCYFPYHYATFLYPALISLLDYLHNEVEYAAEGNQCYINMTVTLSLIGAVVLHIFMSYLPVNSFMTEKNMKLLIVVLLIGNLLLHKADRAGGWMRGITVMTGLFYACYFTSFASDYVQYITELSEKVRVEQFDFSEIPASEEVMYLDSGVGAYILGNQSYLRYYYPLPLQRISGKSEVAKTQMYRNTYQKMMTYQGNYIVCDEGWFYQKNDYKELKDKITREYEKIEQQLPSFILDWSLFEWKDTCGMSYETIYRKRYLSVQ